MNLATIRHQSHMLTMIEIYDIDEKYWLRSGSGRSCEEGGHETFALSQECGRSCVGPTLPFCGNAAESGKCVFWLMQCGREQNRVKNFKKPAFRGNYFARIFYFRCLYTLWSNSKHQLFLVKFWGFGDLFLECSVYVLQYQNFCYWSGREYREQYLTRRCWQNNLINEIGNDQWLGLSEKRKHQSWINQINQHKREKCCNQKEGNRHIPAVLWVGPRGIAKLVYAARGQQLGVGSKGWGQTFVASWKPFFFFGHCVKFKTTQNFLLSKFSFKNGFSKK